MPCVIRSIAAMPSHALPCSWICRVHDDAEEERTRAVPQSRSPKQLVGRYEEAATAYRAALEILPHPVIAGRYGLVLMKLGHLDKAAEELHEAYERGQGVTLQERREVAAAYDKAKALTTWVNVNVSHMGAVITCDGEPWSREGFKAA